MPVISAKNIHKSFGKNKILKGVDMSLEKGEVVAVIGPSGSGKSTFLRCLINLEVIDDGTITIDGDVVVKDGVYKYTTKAPYVSENGNVMVTAKNIADILDLGYDIVDGKYILSKGDTKLTFTEGASQGVSEAPVMKDGQLFVAIKDVLDALGMAYTLEADTLTIG